MAYQVLARKWRPQRFEDVLGQQAVTRTLKNALKSKRIAHAFVFSGPRGCGKTTTARILARALSCVNGPTPDPCGVCDACIEIAEGRDIDVLEIDAATHTGVDNVREVIIEGLSIAPVRNRYKVFIIDEVHMLSALVVQRAAQVDRGAAAARHLHDGDDRAAQDSRYRAVALAGLRVPDHLRRRSWPTACARSPTEEQIEIPDEGLMLLARAGEGSMRDSLSAFDQVRAFAGDTIAVDDVVTVLGLVGRDLVFDMLDAVAGEDAPAAFALVERAIERGYDLRLLCRELARATRDLLILSVDPKRASDPGRGRRRRTRAPGGDVGPVVARGSAARVRSADEGGAGNPGFGSAALQPGDGAAATDASSEAGAARANCSRARAQGFASARAPVPDVSKGMRAQRRFQVRRVPTPVAPPPRTGEPGSEPNPWNRWNPWNLWHPWH